MTDPLRLTEILTTSSAVANYLGAREVGLGHVLSAIAILRGSMTLDDLGRPQSPMLSRATGAGSGAEGSLKLLVQRWLGVLGGDATRALDDEQMAAFEAELQALRNESGDQREPAK